ncbi:DHA2 family efflux MFS transporter permease subunit [Ornithinibacillus sp. 179-J 7C1 HS]|uniref:DHA2 family efflux MFS transporter permease subunit n=1 Tax=Ornithinibacillus sp. 179-J 7C1 HS TaxID=3142384 RepID=UPI0039A1F8E1
MVHHHEVQSVENIRKVPLLAVLLTGAFVAILNQTLLVTALPVIKGDLNIDDNTVQWLQSIFLLVNGIMIPITAFLIARFSTRTLFLYAMGSFALGTFVCAIAPEFFTLLIGRVLQAAGAGVMMPLMQTIMFLIFPVEKRGSAMGLFGLIISFAPAIGPTLSGYLIEHYPWRSLFYVVLPIVIIDIILAYFVLVNVTKQTNPKVDILSIMLSTLGFGGLLYGFSAAGSKGWASAEVFLSVIFGGVILTWFILRQLKLETPILEFRIFKEKIFTLTTVLGMTVFLAMIGGAVILPLLMQDMLGFSPMLSGLAILPGALIMGLMNPITGRLFDKFGAKWLSLIGLIILTAATFLLTILTSESTFTYIATVQAFRMLGIAMVMMPVTTAGLNVLSSEMLPHGTAMNNTLRQMAGAIGTALLVTIMTSSAIPEEGINGIIHGVNMSFAVAGITAAIGLVLTFFIKYEQGASARGK